LSEQEARDHAVRHLQRGRHQFGLRSQQQAQRMMGLVPGDAGNRRLLAADLDHARDRPQQFVCG
jgi:hypothetical protein